MSKCDNCLCNPVCDHNKYGWENCNNFKDKSLFVELPCKVGTKVYAILLGKIISYDVASFIVDETINFVNLAFMGGNILRGKTVSIKEFYERYFPPERM